MRLMRRPSRDLLYRKIRIAHVVFNLGTGGLELGLRRLVQGLDPDRYEQIVVSVLKDGNVPGARVFWLDHQPKGYKFLVPEFARLFAQVRPDVVHSRNWSTIEAIAGAWLARVPAIIHCEHGRNADGANGERLRQRLMRYAYYSMADRVLAVSQDLKDYLHTKLHVPANRLRMISDGVDTSEFGPNAAARLVTRRCLNIPESAFVVGTVARFDSVKDLPLLLRAAARLVTRGIDARVLMVGYGPLRPRLEQLAVNLPELRGRVHFTGEVRNVADWLNGFDAFVLTSLFEGTSVALLEAMAVGVPPVVTTVGGNPEIVQDTQNGYCFQPKDEAALAEHLERLARSADLRARLGAASRRRVQEHYALDHLIRRYEQVYLETLGQASVHLQGESHSAVASRGRS
jgi:sugar transferase (PEP-CTERM/EpsH1 system associated)